MPRNSPHVSEEKYHKNKQLSQTRPNQNAVSQNKINAKWKMGMLNGIKKNNNSGMSKQRKNKHERKEYTEDDDVGLGEGTADNVNPAASEWRMHERQKPTNYQTQQYGRHAPQTSRVRVAQRVETECDVIWGIKRRAMEKVGYREKANEKR